MSWVFGLVIPAILSVAVAFALPPAQNKQTHKPAAAGSTHSVKPNVSSHSGTHHSGPAAARTAGKAAAQLRTVAAHSSGHTVNGRAVYGKTSRGRRMPPRSAGPRYQTRPDEDRYREIQQALSDKGYFKGEVNGQWGGDSLQALQKFQLDNKLPDIYTDGKINSLSLIGLGLGPKHGTHPGEAIPTPPVPSSPTLLDPPASTSASTLSPPQSN